jgi:hypothetical protein
MIKTPLLTTFLLLNLSLLSQTYKASVIYDKEFSKTANNKPSDTFGGISAIESIPVQFTSQTGKDTTMKTIMLVADHYPNVSKPGEQQFSYHFQTDDMLTMSKPKIFYNLNGIECIRYNRFLNQLFYSFESEKSTGIGYIKNTGGMSISESLYVSRMPFHNRGIEGITFTSDSLLWFTFETGTSESSSTIPFYCVPYDTVQMKYDTGKIVKYEYPFDKCSCLKDINCQPHPHLGNGVSEILAFADEPDKLLVLERCWNGTKVKANLFFVRILKDENRFSPPELLLNFNKALKKVDNLEGMAWGLDEGGNAILYIVSDDNYNPAQARQIIKVRITKSN